MVRSWHKLNNKVQTTKYGLFIIFSRVLLGQLSLQQGALETWVFTRDITNCFSTALLLSLYFTAGQGISPVIANEQGRSWLVETSDISRFVLTHGKVEGRPCSLDIPPSTWKQFENCFSWMEFPKYFRKFVLQGYSGVHVARWKWQ